MRLEVDLKEMRPLIEAVAEEMLGRLDAASAATADGKLAYTEAEAAGMLSLTKWQLRDERQRGRISASRVVGNRIMYVREDLIAYLMRNRVNENQ